MIRKGAIDPMELVDDDYGPNDRIAMMDCQCCGKTFYVLERDLYAENAVRGENEPKLAPGIQLQILPKCPHCGYSSKMIGTLTR